MVRYRVAVRRTQAQVRTQKMEKPVVVKPFLDMTYRELQAAAIEKGISGKQTKEALIEALTASDD